MNLFEKIKLKTKVIFDDVLEWAEDIVIRAYSEFAPELVKSLKFLAEGIITYLKDNFRDIASDEKRERAIQMLREKVANDAKFEGKRLSTTAALIIIQLVFAKLRRQNVV